MQKYEKLQKTGEGIYGAVFEAKIQKTHEIVALKWRRLDDNECVLRLALWKNYQPTQEAKA